MPEEVIISSIELIINTKGEIVLQRKDVDLEDFTHVFNTFTPDYPQLDDVITLVKTFQTEAKGLSDYISKHYLKGGDRK